MTKTNRAAVDTAAAKPAELPALLGKLDAAAAKLGGAARVDAWAKKHAAVLEYVLPPEPNLRPGVIVRGLCELFAAADNLNTGDAHASEYLRREAAALRQRQGQRSGILSAAASELHTLHAEGVITDAELKSLSAKLEAIRARVVASPPSKESPGDRTHAATMLGGLLMSLARAIGYGHGKGQGDKYSASRASETLAEIMDLYGFSVSAKRLQNINSAAPEE